MRVNMQMIYTAIIIYPLLNILVCYISQGDNMIILSLLCCLLIYIPLILKKVNKEFLVGVCILITTFVVDLFRVNNISSMSWTIEYVVVSICLFCCSEKYIDIQEFGQIFQKKEKLFYMVHILFLLVLLVHFTNYGWKYGWSTKVLQGPYNYPHTLSYIFLFLLMGDLYLYIVKKRLFALVLAGISTVGILLTGVRTTLLSVAVTILFLLYHLLKEKQFKRLIILLLLMSTALCVLSYLGVWDTLIEKTILAIQKGSITNGRGRIAFNSLQAIKTNEVFDIKKILLGVGIEELLRNNLLLERVAIHAHNDFVDVIVCYGIVNLCLYCRFIYLYARPALIWITGAVGIVAFANGLYMYIDCIPMLLFARLLFETPRQNIENI